MPHLQLTREINVPRVESYLDQLVSDPIQDIGTHELIEGAAFGGEAALIQFLFTWAKNCPAGRLWLKTNDEGLELEQFLAKYSKRAFGFVALLMANDVLTQVGDSCRISAYKECESRVDQLVEKIALPKSNVDEESDLIEDAISNAAYGHRTFLPCVDHSTKSVLIPFYHANGRFRERSEFKKTAETIVSRGSHQFAKANSDVFEGLGTLLFELMHNTNDWARTDVDGTVLRKSIRGVLFTRFYLSKASIGKAAGNNEAIADYMRSVESRNPGQTIHLAELSVFDAGPGLAARWLKQNESDSDGSIEAEHNACVACLGHHRTTSSEAYRGEGLFDVMQTLSRLHALLRLRTGRLAMIRDFISRPLLDSKGDLGPELPLSSEHQTRPDGLAPVVGTNFTILFPLK